MTPAEILGRFRRRGAQAGAPLGSPPPAVASIASAVLIPILAHPEPSILLTRRADGLRAHAGQVALPGGRVEAGESAEEAALREAAEEVGLDPRLPEILGRLPDHLTGTGFRVTPVVALVEPGFALLPAPGEVAEVFEYPLARLLDPAGPERRQAVFQGVERRFWVWPHERHYIWGATAAILLSLARALAEEGA